MRERLARRSLSPHALMSTQRRFLYICLALASVVFSLYGYLWQCDFIDFDDNTHVFENPAVRSGLTWGGIVSAFTHFHAGQWIPLTWLSHMSDVSLFGMDPGAHHLMAVAIHAVNACLLLLALNRLTGAFWPSAAVAALFAVHPMNVEAVAWVAERKSLLSTFFWFLAIALYARHAKRPRIGTMAAIVGCMIAGLLAKGMLVTLPFTLLLLDYWPLERWRTESWRKLATEKIPLFAVSLLASLVTSRAAKSANALVPLEITSVFYRACNAIANYGIYAGKLIWPEKLAILYPLPGKPPVVLAIVSAIAIISVLYAGWRLRIRAPYLLFGCLWFMGTLFPVSGIVQLGKAVLADRFTYGPQIGFFVALVWGASSVVRLRPALLRPITLVGTAALFCLSLRSFAYVQHWKDSVTIFREAAASTERNVVAHSNAGYALARRGALLPAIKHYQMALAISPTDAEIRSNYGVALSRLGNEPAAIEQFERALADDPSDFGARLNLAMHLIKAKQPNAAIPHLERLELTKENPFLIQYWLGRARADAGELERARLHYQTALNLAPNDTRVQNAIADLEKISSTMRAEPKTE